MAATRENNSDSRSLLRRTPLYGLHAELGARFVEFGGWEMPVQYRGILEEHRAVREAAGLFDVSHMGEFVVAGRDAGAFLNYVLTNDVSRIEPDRAQYNLMCRPDGGVVDDLLVYRRGDGAFLLCVNAANTATDFEWLREHAGGFDGTLRDVSDHYALLALQGPKAEEILKPLTRGILGHLRPFSTEETSIAGWDVLLSRTGYTGEDGFELFTPAANAESLARAVLEAGKGEGLQPAGLGARDSLRLEAGYPLYGHELSPGITPLQAGLGWAVRFRGKGDFIGRDALEREKREGPARRVVFFRTGNRRILRQGASVFAGEREVGRVLSGTLSPMLNEAIGSALVDAGVCAEAELRAELRGRSFPLHLVKPPLYTSRKNPS